MDLPNNKDKAEYIERNLLLIRATGMGASFWLTAILCLIGEQGRDWDWLLREEAIGVSNAHWN
jgi:hypothetical protein